MSFQVREKVTILPAVSPTQHGTGHANTVRSVFDENGRLVWEKSPRGFLSHFQYDDATGALRRRIEDVDHTRTGDFTFPLPGGWTTPGGGYTYSK